MTSLCDRKLSQSLKSVCKHSQGLSSSLSRRLFCFRSMCAFLQSRRSGNLSRSAYIMANIMNWAHISFVGRAANLLHAYHISIRYTCTKELVDFGNTNAAPQFLAWHEPGMLTKCSLYVGCNVVWLASKFEPRFLTIHASTKIALISTSRVSIALSIHTTARSPCLFLPSCDNFIRHALW